MEKNSKKYKESFWDMVNKSYRNFDYDIKFFQENSQPVYQIIIDFFKENPDASNEDCYIYIIDLFNEMNSSIARIPPMQGDIIRYNTAQELNRNRKLLREVYELIIEEGGLDELKEDDVSYYSSNPEEARKTYIKQSLLALRHIKAEYSEEEQKNIYTYITFKRLGLKDEIKKIPGEIKIAFERASKLFEGSEYDQLQHLLEQAKLEYSMSIKTKYINSLKYIGEQLKKFGLLKKYKQQNDIVLRKKKLDNLGFSLRGDGKDDIGVEDIFDEEFLKKLNLEELSMLCAFWLNRLSKEVESINEALFFIKELDLWNKIKDAESNKETGNIDVDIDKNKLQNVYSKMAFLKMFINMIYTKAIKKGKFTIIKEDTDLGERRLKKIECEHIFEEWYEEISEEYEEYFRKMLPDSKNSLKDDCEQYTIMENARKNVYGLKDSNIIGILSNLYASSSIKNWGIALEDGTYSKSTKFFLIIIDIQGFNMPIRVHISKKLLLDFIKENQGDTKVPLYMGKEDFDIYGKNMGTQALIPIKKTKEKEIEEYSKDMERDISVKRFLEHLKYLCGIGGFPKHLKIKKVTKKKGKVKIELIIPEKQYIDLETGKLYIMNETGEYEEKKGEDRT